jgi:hypothetical protein
MRTAFRAARAVVVASAILVAVLGPANSAPAQQVNGDDWYFPDREDTPEEVAEDALTLPDTDYFLQVNPRPDVFGEVPTAPFVAETSDSWEPDDVHCEADSREFPQSGLDCVIEPAEALDESGEAEWWHVWIRPSEDSDYPEGETGDRLTLYLTTSGGPDPDATSDGADVTVDDTPPTVEHHWTHGIYVAPRENSVEWEVTDDAHGEEGSGVVEGDPMYSTSYRWVRSSTYQTTQEDTELGDTEGEEDFPLTLNSGFTTFCMAVFAQDLVGNLGVSGINHTTDGEDWVGDECTATSGDDVQLAPANGMIRSTGSDYTFGTVSYATKVGATLTVPGTTAKTVLVKGRTCPTCGTYEVWLGDKKLGSRSLAGPLGFDINFFDAPAEIVNKPLVIKTTSAKWTGFDLVWASGPCLGLAKNCFSLASNPPASDRRNVNPQDTANALVAPHGKAGLAERIMKRRQLLKEMAGR